MQKSITIGKYNILIVFVIALLISSFIVSVWGISIYPFENSKVQIPEPQPYTSIIPTAQIGTTEFSIPLPIKNWALPVKVLCVLTNLTNQGIHQNAPIKINVTLTLDNFAANGASSR